MPNVGPELRTRDQESPALRMEPARRPHGQATSNLGEYEGKTYSGDGERSPKERRNAGVTGNLA